MNKQLSVESSVKMKPVSIMGIRQNCWRLDCNTKATPPLHPNRTLSKYYSLEREELPTGFQEVLVQKDYPINSDSVSSYIESSDYRNDPAQAIANAPKRVNLGDISEVQDFISSNPVDATRQYADVLEKVAKYFKDQSQATAPISTNVKEGETNNG